MLQRRKRSETYSKYEYLSTRKLESILKDSVRNEKYAIEDILTISEILGRRDAGKGIGPPDAEAAWGRFLKRQQGDSTGLPPVEAHKTNLLAKQIQKCAIWAVCIFSAASIIFATQAYGFDIVGSIVHWTNDVFHFETVDSHDGGYEGIRRVDNLPADDTMPVEFIPSWLPDGFEKTAEEKFSIAGLDAYYEEYSDGNHILTFNLTQYDFSSYSEIELFEKQDTKIERVLCEGREFLITKNGETEIWTATLSDGLLVFQLQGDVSKDNLKKILLNLGGSVS